MPTPPPPSRPPWINPDDVLTFPVIDVILTDGQPRIEISGTRYDLTPADTSHEPAERPGDLDKLRDQARRQIARTAAVLGRAVRVTAHEPTGIWTLIIHPDGTIQDGATTQEPKPRRRLFGRGRQ